MKYLIYKRIRRSVALPQCYQPLIRRKICTEFNDISSDREIGNSKLDYMDTPFISLTSD